MVYNTLRSGFQTPTMLKQSRKFDYLVIGGGFAGLNTLAALKRLDNVKSALCVDLNKKPGGSWNNFYNHVHLHADFKSFGVNMHQWHLKDLNIRPSRADVLHHFDSYVKNELPSGFYFQGNTEFKSLSRAGTFHAKLKTLEEDWEVEADHVIDGTGFDYAGHMTKIQDHLTDNESQEEVEMKDLSAVMSQPGPPCGRFIVIVGGGLTGVDAACYCAEHKSPNDEVLQITGNSKFFLSRKYVSHPIPLSKKALGEVFLDLILMYNGNNALECLQAAEQHGCLHRLTDHPADGFQFGFLTDKQKRIIHDNCEIIPNDHFVRCDGRGIHLSSGRLVETQKDIIIVNCRSSVQMRNSAVCRDSPPISEDGVVRPGVMLGLSGPSAYLYTLMYGLGNLGSIKQWTNGDLTRRKMNADDVLRVLLKVTANILVVTDNLPLKFSTTFKMHADAVFPLPRQILSLIKLQCQKKTILKKADKLLIPIYSQK